MALTIKKMLLKNIVPFSFEISDTEALQAIAAKYCDKNGFSLVNPSVEGCKDSDFLENINELFNADSLCSIGVALKKELQINILTEPGRKKVRIVSCEIYLFKSGIGFFRYEFEPDKKLLGNADELITFCNSFKELSYSRNKYNFFLDEIEKTEIICDKAVRAITGENAITEALSSCGYSFQNEGKLITGNGTDIHLECNDTLVKITPSGTAGANLLHINRLRTFSTGNWIASMLEDIPGLHFTPQRKGNIPDTALQMSYSYIASDSQEETYDYIFRVAHGYNTSYNRPLNNTEDIYTPFENVHFLVTFTGMAQCAVSGSSQKTDSFFEQGAYQRAENYFFVYLLVLHQYYGLLHQSQKSSCISTSSKAATAAELHSLEKLIYEMHQFSMRNMFPEVSYLPNYNSFYSYAQNMININRIYEQTSQQLTNMSDIAEKIESERHNDWLYIFTIIGAMFAITEVVVNVSDIVSMTQLGNESQTALWLWTGLAIAAMLGLSMLLWFIRGALKRRIKSEFKRKDVPEKQDKR